MTESAAWPAQRRFIVRVHLNVDAHRLFGFQQSHYAPTARGLGVNLSARDHRSACERFLRVWGFTEPSGLSLQPGDVLAVVEARDPASGHPGEGAPEVVFSISAGGGLEERPDVSIVDADRAPVPLAHILVLRTGRGHEVRGFGTGSVGPHSLVEVIAPGGGTTLAASSAGGVESATHLDGCRDVDCDRDICRLSRYAYRTVLALRNHL